MAKFSVLAVVMVVLAGLSAPALAGSKVYLGQSFPPDQRVPFDRIDHGLWDQLLRTYVDADGMVDYAAWKRSAADLGRLDQYLATLSRGSLRTPATRQSQLAFWINAYNAITLRGILREYPTSSIRNHTAKVWGYNIWDDLLLRIGGESYSLNTIEHKILRKMHEPRVHFAIVCASIGCPRLRSEAYTPQRVEAQLADNTRDFFSRPKNFRVDTRRGTVYVSSILKWFAEDFGGSPQAGVARFADYLPDESARRLVAGGSFPVSYLDYDWNLNDRSAGRR